MQLSLIVTVLESYEVVRRHLLHLGRILTPAVDKPFAFTFHYTNDRRPWTQPRARNIGAGLARAAWLLFFDIDHILTVVVSSECLAYAGAKLHWMRRPGVLDEQGQIRTDPEILRAHGLKEDEPSVPCG